MKKVEKGPHKATVTQMKACSPVRQAHLGKGRIMAGKRPPSPSEQLLAVPLAALSLP